MRSARHGWPAVLAPILVVALSSGQRALSQAQDSPSSPGITKLCTISFDKDKRRPARVGDDAITCLSQAKQILIAHQDTALYLVGTADRQKDNDPGHGHARTEQDMSGEDLRYADVAAYRAINTKAYLVTWLGVNPTRVVPLTSYEDGQQVAFYLVNKGLSFKHNYGKPTAPILSKPCTVKPCATGPEEFLLAQQREQISVR